MNLTIDSVSFTAKTNLAQRFSHNSPFRQKAELVAKAFKEKTSKNPNDVFSFVKNLNGDLSANYNVYETTFPMRKNALEYLVENFPIDIAADKLKDAFDIFKTASQTYRVQTREASQAKFNYIKEKVSKSPILDNMFKSNIYA